MKYQNEMKKRTIILSEEQINNIIGEEWNVNVDTNIDTPKNNYSSEVFSSSSIDGNFPDPTTSDEISSDLTNDLYGPWKRGGLNGNVYTIREWKKKRLNEDIQDSGQGNAVISFSDSQGKELSKEMLKNSPNNSVGKKTLNGEETEDRIADIRHDLKDAKEKADKYGDFSTLNRMGGEDFYKAFMDKTDRIYTQEKNNRKAFGNHIKSTSKISGYTNKSEA